jgi:hypothetical protein
LRSIEVLKSQGLSNRAVAHRLGVDEKAIRKLVGPSKPAESEQLAFAGMARAAAETPPAVPSAQPPDDDADCAMACAKAGADDGDPITLPAEEGEPVPMSLDRDASDRTFDRQLAYLGLLDDAAPLFREGSSVPGVGVLLALPCLVESGLLRISRKLYGDIGPAFYGLRTTGGTQGVGRATTNVPSPRWRNGQNLTTSSFKTSANTGTRLGNNVSEKVRIASYPESPSRLTRSSRESQFCAATCLRQPKRLPSLSTGSHTAF